MKKRKVQLVVKIKGQQDKLPDFGLGKGVLGTLNVDIDLRNSTIIQEIQLFDTAKEFVDQLIIVERIEN